MPRPAASADVFRAVADPTRRAIIEVLVHGGPASPSALADRFDLCQSTVSGHLAVLRAAGLVSYTEQAGRRRYRVVREPLTELATWAVGVAPPTDWSSRDRGVTVGDGPSIGYRQAWTPPPPSP